MLTKEEFKSLDKGDIIQTPSPFSMYGEGGVMDWVVTHKKSNPLRLTLEASVDGQVLGRYFVKMKYSKLQFINIVQEA